MPVIEMFMFSSLQCILENYTHSVYSWRKENMADCINSNGTAPDLKDRSPISTAFLTTTTRGFTVLRNHSNLNQYFQPLLSRVYLSCSHGNEIESSRHDNDNDSDTDTSVRRYTTSKLNTKPRPGSEWCNFH